MDNNNKQTRKEQVIGKVAEYLQNGGYTVTESGSNVVAEEIYHLLESDLITDEIALGAAAGNEVAQELLGEVNPS